MKNIKIMAAEIQQGKNMEENLSNFSKRLAEMYYELGLLNLTMNYYTLYEMIQDNNEKTDEKVQILLDSIHGILKESMSQGLNGQKVENLTKQLYKHRSNIEMRMQMLTNYMDILQNYEYVLNRVELRYVKDSYEETEERAIQEIANYVFDDKDNVVINSRIKEVLGQLPVRMTRGRFFELIENSFTIYKQADNSSIDNYLYILRTSAMLEQSEYIVGEFPLLKQIVERLEQADYKNLTEEEYYALTEQLHIGAEYIRNMVDIYIYAVEIVNKLYVVLLSAPYVMSTESVEEKACKEILKELYQGFIKKDYEIDYQLLVAKLEITEGKQEEIGSNLMHYEGLLSEIHTVHHDLIQSIMLGKIYNGLYASQVLLSSSYFALIEPQDIKKDKDEHYLEKATATFMLALEESFKDRSQNINRAIMANLMSKLPVFFKDTQEVIEYITDVFRKCNDEAEKLASIHIIKQLAQDN